MAEQRICSYNSLVQRMQEAIRREALTIRKFKEEGNGCIRFMARPCSPEADKWLGGLSNFEAHDIVKYETVYTIKAGGSHTMIANSDIGPEKVNCYGYSALKVAHASLARKRGVALMSGVDLIDRDLVEENGWGPYYGAICFEVKKKVFIDGRSGEGVIANNYELLDYARIYVAVSGASDKEDLQCALAATPEIEKFFAAKDRDQNGKSLYAIRGHGHPEFKLL